MDFLTSAALGLTGQYPLASSFTKVDRQQAFGRTSFRVRLSFLSST
jgi:hypothetical protein